jgi:hypothetical protein
LDNSQKPLNDSQGSSNVVSGRRANASVIEKVRTDNDTTLTQGKIVLEKTVNVDGDPSDKVLHYGYLNSYHHTGLKNLRDEAILDHESIARPTTFHSTSCGDGCQFWWKKRRA